MHIFEKNSLCSIRIYKYIENKMLGNYSKNTFETRVSVELIKKWDIL